MHRLPVLAIAAVLVMGFAPPTGAAELGIGLRAGTQGLGAELGVGVTRWFGVRAGYYALDYSDDFEEAGIRYDGTLKLGGAGLFADFFPLRGNFRLTAGLFSNRNELELGATATEPQEIGGTVYDPSEIGRLSGNVDFNSTAPYLGIGWGRVAGSGRIGFLFDLGILKQGSGDVTLTSTGTIDPADLEREAAEIEDDIDEYDFWPVISFGLAIRF